MRLALPTAGMEHYKSASQCARVGTEAWAEANLYCPNCDSDRLSRLAVNTPGVDYACPRCDSSFQLKSQSRKFSHRVTDAAYAAMLRIVLEDRAPNLFLLHYRPDVWFVQNLILVPRFAFSTSLLEKRKPLGPGARRAGWIGCNIIVGNVPPDARISVVFEGTESNPDDVRRQYARLRPLQNLTIEKRGWTLDVLKAVRSLGKPEFSLGEAYSCEETLARLHPANRHVRDKIRQQLQVLRDLNLLDFLGGGKYRLR